MQNCIHVETNSRFNSPYWHLSERDASSKAKALSLLHKVIKREYYEKNRGWSVWLKTKMGIIKTA